MTDSIPTAYFDADCGFCTASVQKLAPFNLSCTFTSLQSVDLAALGIDPNRALEEMAFKAADGTVVYGHLAWAGILSTGNPALKLAGQVLASRLLDRPAKLIYRTVAQNRDKLPGGTGTCAMPRH